MTQYKEDKIIRNARHMAWERAKGELYLMLYTFWGEQEKFERTKEEMDNFITSMEDGGLYE